MVDTIVFLWLLVQILGFRLPNMLLAQAEGDGKDREQLTGTAKSQGMLISVQDSGMDFAVHVAVVAMQYSMQIATPDMVFFMAVGCMTGCSYK